MAGSDILEGLDVFLVGGAVRDKLLGTPGGDRDWVVVGATSEEMRSRGFKPVGREFPVFLHPRTREEYALARTERKTGPGYTGFEFSTAEGITLEQDLYRRDLTVNAMAMTPDGALIDPFHGRRDLRDRVLRHVSNAFVEDPVRILRVARFHARYGFDIAPETWALMRSMVAQGEVDTLVAERIWLELRGALCEKKPSMFFRALRNCGALCRTMPEIDNLFGVPQDPERHPEIDSGVHTMMVVDQAAKLTGNVITRFAALVHDLGKAATPKNQWPSHRGHEFTGLECIKDFCERMRIPNKFRDAALIACETHLALHRIHELDSPEVLALLETAGVFRQPYRLEQMATVAEADSRGRQGFEDQPYPQADTLRRCFQAANAVDSAAIARRHDNGIDIARGIRAQRIASIRTARGG